MAELPKITEENLRALFPELREIARPVRGGHKLVFPCIANDRRFVLKVLRCDIQETADAAAEGDASPEETVFDLAAERARREVDVLRGCNSPHVAKLGPIELRQVEVAGQRLIIFSEEQIDGRNLEAILGGGPMSISDLILLARHMARAVDEIWKQRRIHRDINPKNVMRRSADGSFVLLDPGIAFDVDGESLTSDGFIPHTPGWIAPEHCNAFKKHESDCRADLFLVGLLLYKASTGVHPFTSQTSRRRKKSPTASER